MTLEDDVIVYPGHGAGSACGKKMAKETWGYLGDQKRMNYALRADMTREEFVKEVTEGLVEPPQYFPKNAMLNKMGYESLDEIRKRGIQGLSPRAFKAAWEGKKALVIDTRSKEEFAEGYIPGSYFYGLDGSFAQWVGALVEDLTTPILFLCEEGREEEVVTRLSRVGYDNPIGYLEGGIDAWKEAGEAVAAIEEVSASEFSQLYDKNKVDLLDVRKCSEYNAEHIKGAEKMPLDFIYREMSSLDKDKTYYLYCKTGYRSLLAASILKKEGVRNVINIRGGMEELVNTPIQMTEYVEQNTEL
jgi:rhodanese-related sulfurtransferase